MAIVSTSDFSGKYQLPKDQYSVVAIQAYIDKYTPLYLARLLGAGLSTELIEDIGEGTEPTNPVFEAIFNPFMQDDECEGLIVSNGIKEMLIGFIYWHFLSDKKVNADSVSGTSSPMSENATVNKLPEAQVYSRYNDSIDTARAIQWKCKKESANYPNYNGSKLVYNYVI